MHNQPIYFLFLILFLPVGCSRQPVMTTTSTDTARHKFTYLALGDSYTIGEGASESERWPVQLAGLLRQDSVDVTDPDIIARTGWTTAELYAAIRQSGNQKTYDLVSLLIGVNNQYRGQPTDVYRTEFRTLLQTAISFAGNKASRVFVLSIPDWGRSPFAAEKNQAAIASAIDEFNTIARDECQQLGVAFVDITPITRSVADDPTQFVADGLHYSGRQMLKWAEQARPDVAQLLVN